MTDDAPTTAPDAPEAGDAPVAARATAASAARSRAMGRTDKLPIKMLQDRLLVHIDVPEGERRSTGGILIPATAQLGKRLQWAEVKAAGPNVRNIEVGDQVLFNPGSSTWKRRAPSHTFGVIEVGAGQILRAEILEV